MKKEYAFHFGDDDRKRLGILNDICNFYSQRFLSPYIQKGMNILEVGSGHGHMLPWLLNQVGEEGHVTAVDADNEQISVIKSKIPHQENLILKSASVYHLEDLSYYDCIYCRFLFMHLDNPEAAIKSMYSKLNKNGILLIEEPTLSSNFCFPQSSKYDEAINLLFKLGITFNHDYDIGLKLIKKIKTIGASVKNINFAQPVLFTKEQKSILRLSLIAAENKFINANLIGKKELMELFYEIEKLESDNDYIFALSRQTQIAAIKS